MAITAAGVGSGIDIESIVSQLMTLERRPLVALQRRESDTRAQISDFGTLKSAVSSFQDAMRKLGSMEAFRVFQTASTDEGVAQATATSAAAAGLYNLDVSRLAQNHKMGSQAFASTDSLGGGGADALTLSVAGESMTIDMSSAQTLAQLRDAINSAGDNPGVTATILNVGNDQQRLILTADESGYEQRVQLSYAGGINAGTFGFATTNRDSQGIVLADLAELDAVFQIDGFDLSAASNNVSSVIDGLSLELRSEGSTVISVSRDNAAIEASAKEFVDAFNNVLSTVASLRNGNLGGDSTLRSIEQQMRDVLNTAPTGLTGAFTALSEVGIKTDRTTGLLTLNGSEFSRALDSDFSAVAQLFASDDQGYAFRFAGMAEGMLARDGLIDGRVDGLNARARRLVADQTQMESRLDLRELGLRRQYAALDKLVGSLQSTNTFLLQNFF